MMYECNTCDHELLPSAAFIHHAHKRAYIMLPLQGYTITVYNIHPKNQTKSMFQRKWKVYSLSHALLRHYQDAPLIQEIAEGLLRRWTKTDLWSHAHIYQVNQDSNVEIHAYIIKKNNEKFMETCPPKLGTGAVTCPHYTENTTDLFLQHHLLGFGMFRRPS